MNKFIFYLILCLLAFSSFAKEESEITSEQADLIHSELRALRETMQRAMNEQNIDAILENVDKNIVFSTMNGDVLHGQNNLRAYFEKMMKGPDRIVDSVTTHFVTDAPSILYENDIAIAFGHSDDIYELAIGKTFTVRPIWSATMIRRNGSWKIANFHYSVNMFDNPILDAQRQLIWIIGIAGIIFALVTFLIGRRFKRL